MAIERIQVIYCDPHQASGEKVDGEHFKINLNGEIVKVDLCAECQETYLSGVHALIALLKKPSKKAGGKKKAGPDPSDVREWAEAHGYEVSNRGRVPAEITAAYEAATNT